MTACYGLPAPIPIPESGAARLLQSLGQKRTQKALFCGHQLPGDWKRLSE